MPELPDPWLDLVGDSAPMRAVRATLRRLAETSMTVLLTGETGTGKSAAALALHTASSRRQEPFVAVDCSSLPPTLIETELFGCEPGAYTGALGLRRGRAERAGAGTLLLDEIGELAPPLQAKLLSLIEDRSFERVGGERRLPLRARLVAATHVDLERCVNRGTFRADLFYRLEAARVRLPPLQERPEDVPMLAARIVQRLELRHGCHAPTPDPDWLRHLATRPWPGNVRELANVLERWLVLGEAAALDDARTPAFEPGDEAERIRHALRAAGGNVARAARRLQLPRTTLRRRIRRYGLEGELPRD